MGDDKKSSGGDDSKRVELVAHSQQPMRAVYVGLGLLVSLAIGFGPLTDAWSGNGSFEGAIGRFVACVVFCLVAASFLSRLMESGSAPAPESEVVGQSLGSPEDR